MTPERWHQIDASLDELLDCATPAEQAAVVERLRTSDVELAREVEQLWKAQNQSEDFLATPPLKVAVNAAAPLVLLSLTGQMVGAYRLLEEVGRGGMGIVYLAERADELYQQQVAIKMVWPWLQSPEIFERFSRERQILASLDHPGIARLLDGGTTSDGSPYLVMEYVKGTPITKYCHAHNLSLVERLKIFQEVCGAVDFAHRNLVVHRDLKPSNILVTEDGAIKLLDFGIAKLLVTTTDEPSATSTGSQLLTIAYASPEQIRNEPITTASDVYSLGVVLYELLAGERPFQGQPTLPHEFAQLICEVDPTKPSTTLARQQAERIKEPERKAAIKPQALVADLDNIVLAALHKKPAQRYPSIASFSDDIQRYLSGNPVRAHRATIPYRLRKYVQRHKVGFALSCAFVLALLGGIVATIQQARIAKQETRAKRRLLYAAQMNLAAQAWEANNLAGLRWLVDQQIPLPGEEDLRGFEWHYYRQLSHPKGEVYSLAHAAEAVYSAVSPDGQLLVTAGLDQQIHFWEAASGKAIASLKIAGSSTLHAVFSPDSRWLATAGTDGVIRFWNAQTHELVRSLAAHTARANMVAFAPDGKRFVSCGDDNFWKLWDFKTGAEILTRKAHGGLVRAIAYSPDGKLIATGGNVVAVKLWNAATGELIPSFQVNDRWQTWGLAFSPNSSKLAAGGTNSIIKVWEVKNAKEIATLTAHQSFVSALAYSPDGQTLGSASYDTTVKFWSTDNWQELVTLKGHTASIRSLVFAPDGQNFMTASDDGTACRWHLPTILAESAIAPGHNRGAIGYNHDVSLLATTGKNFSVRLIEAKSNREIAVLSGHTAYPGQVAFSPDGTKVATGSSDQTVRLWEVNSGRELAVLRGHQHEITYLAFSPDNSVLATGSVDETVRLWHGQTGQSLVTLNGQTGIPYALAFSPNGALLATGSHDGQVKLWNVRSGQLLATLSEHAKSVAALAFSRDSKLLASGGDETVIHLWNVNTHREQAVLRGLSGQVRSLAFSPDSSRLVAGNTDGIINLWDPLTQTELISIKGHTQGINFLSFAADGLTLYSGSLDGTARSWRTAR